MAPRPSSEDGAGDFPPHAPLEALEAMLTLREQADQLADKHGFELKLGANLHLGPAVTAGVRISDALYQELPSAERTPWEKQESAAVYTLKKSEESR